MSVLVFISTFLIFLSLLTIRRDRKEEQLNRIKGTDLKLEESKLTQKKKQKKDPAYIVKIKKAGLSWRSFEYFLINIVASLILGALTFITVKGILFAFIGSLAGPALVNYYIKRKILHRSEYMSEQFKPALRSMGNQMKANKKLPQALIETMRETEEPLRSELQLISDDIASGVSISDAFENAQERIPVKEFKVIAVGVKTSIITGSDLTQTFYNATKMITKRQEGREKAYTQTQSIRGQGTASTFLLIFIFFFLRFIFKDFYTAALNVFIGQVVLFGFIVSVIFLNVYVKKQIDSIEY